MTKGGTDIVDQIISHYTTKFVSTSWTKVAFCYMLDTTFVNSATLFTKANNMQLGKKQNRPYLLEMEMAKSLFMPYIKARSRKGLQEGILRKIRFVLKEKDIFH